MKKPKILIMVTCFSLIFSIQSFAGWVQQESGQWKYDQNGTLVTNQWVEDQGSWYYLNENGEMLANTTQRIDGEIYTFDVSGKWIDPNASAEITYRTYTNKEMGYSLQIPSNVATTAFDGNSETFEVNYNNMAIQFINDMCPAYLDPKIYADTFAAGFISGFKGKMSYIDKINTQLGDFSVSKSSYLYSDSINIDLYTCIRGYKIFYISVMSIPDTNSKAFDIINTLKELP
ncbi:hypothetical protein [Lacrimispora sp.]|uniref:hypothetical protein n=1 Tax=Lacrimispora sp. TaxID=2719234 RepID=UPI0029DF8D6C|nr:lysozyme [Lacrimispora sp.]